LAARILIVEDNHAHKLIAAYLLQASGYEFMGAHDGMEAIAIAERERPALVLCDVDLPRLDGYDVLRYLKEHPTLHAVPCIAVTALAMIGDRERMLDAGFDGYISKPIVPETFIGSIVQFLSDR